jgi:plastocyanin
VTWRFGDAANVIFGAAAGAPADINITNDQDVSRTFPTLGTFRYDCTIHPGMSGVVEVKPRLADASRSSKASPPTSIGPRRS